MTTELSFSSDCDRLPPQNVEAEEAILGGILLDSHAYERIAHKLTPQSFYVNAHSEIYRAMASLVEKSKPTDLLSVVNWLIDCDLLARVGGRNKLASLIDRTVSSVNIDSLADLVAEKYKRRELVRAGDQISNLGYETETELEQIFERAESRLLEVTGDAFGDTEPTPLSEIMVNTYQTIENRHNGTSIVGFPTGFYDLDAMIGGLKPGKLITIAARPAMGKSSFLGNIALNLGATNLPCVLFSLEMDKEEYGERFLSFETNIESGYFQSGRIAKNQWEPIAKGIADLSELPIYIDDAPSIGITAIRAKVRRLIAKHGQLGMVGIDYLGLMDGVDDSGNLAFAIGKITRSLKQLARECNVPIVLLCQLNRAVEGRQNKRPTLSDLRDSGRIEEDSDMVIGLYREEHYDPQTTEKGIAEIVILKHRGGPVGTVKLLFDSQFTKFKNLSRPSSQY